MRDLRLIPLALVGGCFGGGNCAPAPQPLPDAVSGPMAILSARVQSGWSVFTYGGMDVSQTTVLALVPQSQLANVNSSLDQLLNDLSSVMLAPGGGQGGGSFQQPTHYDTMTGVWDTAPYELQLSLQGDPVAWKLQNGGATFVTGAADSLSTATSTLDFGLGVGFPLTVGSIQVSYSNQSIDGCIEYYPSSAITYTDGTGARFAFSGGLLCDDSQETRVELDAAFPGLGARHEQVAVHWAPDASGRADAVVTGQAAPQTVHATECWHVDAGEVAVVDYYVDDSGLNATVGTPDLCSVDAAP